MLFLLVKVAAASACSMTPTHLRTNNLVSPLGIPSTHAPLLSWSLADTASPPTRGLVQSAYQIRASSSPSGMPMIWDSGKVASSETLQLAYGGPTLLSSERVWWRVVVWDGADAECQGSAPDAAFFEQAVATCSAVKAAREVGRKEGNWARRRLVLLPLPLQLSLQSRALLLRLLHQKPR